MKKIQAWIEEFVMWLVSMVYGEDVQILDSGKIIDLKHDAQETVLQGQDEARARAVRDAEKLAASDAQRATLEAIDKAFMLAGADLSVGALFDIVDVKANGVESELGGLRDEKLRIEMAIRTKTEELQKYGDLLAKLR
jgi:hypothetical protein